MILNWDSVVIIRRSNKSSSKAYFKNNVKIILELRRLIDIMLNFIKGKEVYIK